MPVDFIYEYVVKINLIEYFLTWYELKSCYNKQYEYLNYPNFNCVYVVIVIYVFI